MALPFRHRPEYRADAFLAADSNAAARLWLSQPKTWPDGRLILWGEPGCGKTHLAQIWGAGGAVLQGAALPHAALLPHTTRLVIDDADSCTDEPTMLHLLNACREAGHHVLLTGQAPPARWILHLPDLASRLRAAQAVAIDPPDDALLRALLARLLAERQLVVSATMQDWLRLRLPRTARAMQAAAARLDSLSLARGKPITPALARSGLHGLLDEASMTADAPIPAATDPL